MMSKKVGNMKNKKTMASITFRISVVIFLIAIGAIVICQAFWIYSHMVEMPEYNFINPCSKNNNDRFQKPKIIPYSKNSRGRFSLEQETKKVTMMLNTFQRPQQLVKSIKHYSQCQDILQDIRVTWYEDEKTPETQKHGTLKVIFDKMDNSSFNNRFKPVQGIKTECVMSIDDDIYMPCEAIKKAFKAWKKEKNALVGFYPRSHSFDESCNFKYLIHKNRFPNGHYSIILTKVALLHRDYLMAYTYQMPQSIRDFIDENRNCEDIAMQLLVASFTDSYPAKFVNYHNIKDDGDKVVGGGIVSGVSKHKNHVKVRSYCLKFFSKELGGVQLTYRPLSEEESLIWIKLSRIISSISSSFSK